MPFLFPIVYVGYPRHVRRNTESLEGGAGRTKSSRHAATVNTGDSLSSTWTFAKSSTKKRQAQPLSAQAQSLSLGSTHWRGPRQVQGRKKKATTLPVFGGAGGEAQRVACSFSVSEDCSADRVRSGGLACFCTRPSLRPVPPCFRTHTHNNTHPFPPPPSSRRALLSLSRDSSLCSNPLSRGHNLVRENPSRRDFKARARRKSRALLLCSPPTTSER